MRIALVKPVNANMKQSSLFLRSFLCTIFGKIANG
jgi:hypothetical protein